MVDTDALKFRTLKADEIEVRIASCKETGVSLLLYKNARVDMDLLDENVGTCGWQRELIDGGRICSVKIYNNELKEWVHKEDVGSESNVEKEKGLASDSFKRACVNWGIGRELYSAPFIWVAAKNLNNLKKVGERFVCYDKFSVAKITYDDKRKISALAIENNDIGKVVFVWQSKKEQS
jgi:hypothetical protein